MTSPPQHGSPEPASAARPTTLSGEAAIAFRETLVGLIPYLRAFARTLTGNRDLADDLVQDTLARAWQARASFQPGTNQRAWLFMILRNQFYSERRRSWRQEAWDETMAANTLVTGAAQHATVDLADMERALKMLPDEQREALILVGAGGFSYDEAAQICGCAVGTIKSRVARARRALEAALAGEGAPLTVERGSGNDAADDIFRELDELAAQHPSALGERSGS